jgi:hypothetical protein
VFFYVISLKKGLIRILTGSRNSVKTTLNSGFFFLRTNLRTNYPFKIKNPSFAEGVNHGLWDQGNPKSGRSNIG